MNSSLQREEDLFDAARNLPPGPKRAAFLARACAGEELLRSRIEALLRSDASAERFFTAGRTAFGAIGIPPEFKAGLTLPEAALGTRIGVYEILEKIGEGGCGAVYLAEQEEPFRRRVALKIIRIDLASKTVMARFEAERQALALMDHPNIARVFDAGMTARRSPYFVMELVQGSRLTEYCDRYHLSLRERLNLFILVCHAIQHAHQKGIVHGDIKPSNILVTLHDGIPVPKVIDFGISKATEVRPGESALPESYGPLVGTPAYMSPEQADLGSLGIDTRSDIYALGVLLYELLAGATPFDARAMLASGLEEMRRILREVVPLRPAERFAGLPAAESGTIARCRALTPSGLISALRGDLDAIAMRALEKDRQRRYETANGLAMDLQRHLSNEPVVARPDHRLYRLGKLIRRNQGVFAAGGAVALALVAGFAVSTLLFLREKDARQRAVAAEQQQNELRQKAEVREKITQAVLLVNQERFDEADRILEGLKIVQPTVEGAAVLRSVGEWHALQTRWAEAAKRFGQLLRVDQLDGHDAATLDYLEQGPVLVFLDDRGRYDQFRQDAITRFSGTSLLEADRILKVSLLRPADRPTLDSLRPLAEETLADFRLAAAGDESFQAAWRALSLALWEYRLGHYQAAAEWGQKCIAAPEANVPRTATARLILALCSRRLGRDGEAAAQWRQADAPLVQKLRNPLSRGSPMQGFWFDWMFAEILRREAAEVFSTTGHP